MYIICIYSEINLLDKHELAGETVFLKGSAIEKVDNQTTKINNEEVILSKDNDYQHELISLPQSVNNYELKYELEELAIPNYKANAIEKKKLMKKTMN